MYLIEKSLCNRENRPCELPAPKKLWFWTPRWQKFLILPKIPSNIKRRASLKFSDSSTSVVPQASSNGSRLTKPIPSDLSCPRLSLHLDAMTPLLPSLIDSAAWESSRGLPHEKISAHGSIQEQQDHGALAQEEKGLPVILNMSKHKAPSHEGLDKLNQIIVHPESRLPGEDLPCEDQFSDVQAVLPGSKTPEKVHFGPRPSFQESLAHTDNADDYLHEASSMHSQDSGKTVVIATKTDDQVPEKTSTPRGTDSVTGTGLTIRHGDEDGSPPPTFDCNLVLKTLDDVSTPLAYFLLGPNHPRRSTFVRQVVSGSGGHLHQEDPHRPQLDTVDSRISMIPELQPAPLRLRRRDTLTLRREKTRPSSLEAPTGDSSGQIEDSDPKDQTVLEYGNDDGPPTVEVGSPTLRRTTTKIKSRSKPQSIPTSFNISPDEPSGFTPRHGLRAKLPREPQHSPTIPGFRPYHPSSGDSETSFAETTAQNMHHNTRVGVVPPKVEASTGRQPEPQGPRTLAGVDDDEIYTPRLSRSLASLRHFSSDQSSFSMERAKSRGALTILPRSEARFFTKDSPSHSSDISTPMMSPGPGQLKHAIEPRSSSLRSNMTTQERLSRGQLQSDRPETPSPNTPTAQQRTVSSTFGTLFRKRARDKPLRTVTAPSTHWKPFEEQPYEPPYSSSWSRGRQGDGDAKEQRAAFFKEKVDREELERRTLRYSHRSSGESRLRPRSSRETLVDFKTAIDSYPAPSLPDAPAYRDKKPEGLAVETTMANRLLRKPQSTSSGLRTAFRRGVRRASLSKIVMDEEEK